jgi:hypothetical protein
MISRMAAPVAFGTFFLGTLAGYALFEQSPPRRRALAMLTSRRQSWQSTFPHRSNLSTSSSG